MRSIFIFGVKVSIVLYLLLVCDLGDPVAAQGASSATGTPQGASSATGTAQGASSGTGTPQGASSATGTAQGASSGTGTPQGASSATGTAQGASSGTGTPQGASSATGTPQGASSGTGTPQGASSATGTPQGASSATGTPQGASSATGTPQGASSATGPSITYDCKPEERTKNVTIEVRVKNIGDRVIKMIGDCTDQLNPKTPPPTTMSTTPNSTASITTTSTPSTTTTLTPSPLSTSPASATPNPIILTNCPPNAKITVIFDHETSRTDIIGGEHPIEQQIHCTNHTEVFPYTVKGVNMGQNVTMFPTTEKMETYSTQVTATLSMEFTNSSGGALTQAVEVGTKINITIKVARPSKFHGKIKPIACRAQPKNTKNNTTSKPDNSYTFWEDQGGNCVFDNQLILQQNWDEIKHANSMLPVGVSNSLYAFRFKSSAEVTITCDVRVCPFYKEDCNLQQTCIVSSSGKRRRRDTRQSPASRHQNGYMVARSSFQVMDHPVSVTSQPPLTAAAASPGVAVSTISTWALGLWMLNRIVSTLWVL